MGMTLLIAGLVLAFVAAVAYVAMQDAGTGGPPLYTEERQEQRRELYRELWGDDPPDC